MERRWTDHVAAAKRSKGGRWHFPNAIRKYGPEAFSHEVLEVVATSLEDANAAEERWIEKLQTRNPEKGFNLAKGGQHIPHPIRRNPWDRPEYRERATEASRKVWSDPSVRSKASASMKARWQDPAYVRAQSETARIQASRPEVKAAFAEASRKRWENPEVRSNYDTLWSDPIFKATCTVGLKARNERESKKTHCKYGHEFTEENTHAAKKGRECRACRNAGERARQPTHRREQLMLKIPS
jgi:hypothetical protein